MREIFIPKFPSAGFKGMQSSKVICNTGIQAGKITVKKLFPFHITSDLR